MTEPPGEGPAAPRPSLVPSPDQIAQEDFLNNCFTRAVISGGMGGLFGGVFGIFSASLEGTSGSMASEAAAAAGQKAAPWRESLRDAARSAGSKSLSYAKGFGAVGLLFAGSECLIESYRAKHDIYNSAYAGCFTGAALAHSGGPKMMCLGCGSFAAFSVLLERFLD
ncbi:unnamed protein product [Ostreobium quekettii]|uniref:Mitochondrial import inner membrane translocase subunit TIM22 n=1 Tax=Ostreobium quekettii TaxID=121088 RepID=A0A8S1J471_9CHLO|nr:unnamed protein product [Ostreobium quekettii]|eukprot:evm.model.scf_290.4 EVM.evm.TU.scf_290.4   scf_290:102372-102872(+)